MKPPIERLLTDSPVLIFLCHEILPKTYVKSSHLMTYRNWKNSYKKYMISVIIKNNNKKMRKMIFCEPIQFLQFVLKAAFKGVST